MKIACLEKHRLGLRPFVSACRSAIELGIILCLLPSALLSAADWPRLGGLDGTGVSAETGLARNFPAEGPPVRWTVDVGEGFAGPAVSKGEVFLLDRAPNQSDVLRCIDLGTGKELWKLAYDAPGSLPFNGSRNVPTVDEQSVFTVGPFGNFRCVDRQSHRLVWSAHLINDFKDPEIDGAEDPVTRDQKLMRTQLPMWGMTQAPLLYQDMVIVAPQTQKTGLVAYDQHTGKIRWRSAYIGRNWYSHVSPYLTTLCGVPQVIMLAQPSDPEKAPDQAPPAMITSVDPGTGKILWTTRTPGPYKIPIPQPVRVGSDRLFITGGYTLGCLMFQILHSAEGWETKLLFHNRNVAGHIHSPILYDNRIYVTSFKEQGGSRTGLACLNNDGEPLWSTGPTLQFESGGFLIADGLAFIMQGKTGELSLLDLTSSDYKLLGKAKVLEAKGANVWAPLALSDGNLIVRDQHQVKCLVMRNAASL